MVFHIVRVTNTLVQNYQNDLNYLEVFPLSSKVFILKMQCAKYYLSEIKFCFIMPTFKGLMPNTFLTPTFWVLNWFLSFILCYYWVVQAHLQKFRVLEVFWCHGIIENSHLCCLHSAIVSFPLGNERAESGQLRAPHVAGKKPSWIGMKCSALHFCDRCSNTGPYSRQLQSQTQCHSHRITSISTEDEKIAKLQVHWRPSH